MRSSLLFQSWPFILRIIFKEDSNLSIDVQEVAAPIDVVDEMWGLERGAGVEVTRQSLRVSSELVGAVTVVSWHKAVKYVWNKGRPWISSCVSTWPVWP